jgi:ABC-type nitrate/sulfonate/bicarbonate transport system substrate-binding protein
VEDFMGSFGEARSKPRPGRTISRRLFVRGALTTSGLVLLAACAPAAPPAPTAAPAKPTEAPKPAAPAAPAPAASPAAAPAAPSTGAGQAKPAASPAAAPAAAPAASPAAAPAAAKPTGPLKKVRIGLAGYFLPLASVPIALDKGYYRDQGIEAEITIAPSLQGAQGVLAGNLDLHAGGATDVTVMAEKGETMTAIVTPQPVQVLGLVIKSEVLERIGVKPGDPLEKRLGAMKGLNISVTGIGGAADTTLNMMLREAKLQPTDVNKLPINSQSGQLAALDQGQIDGIVAGPPLMDQLEYEKKALILVPAEEIPIVRNAMYEVVFGTKSWVDAHPDEARGVAKAVASANKFLKEDPTAARFMAETHWKTTPEPVLKLSLDKSKQYLPTDGKMDPKAWTGLVEYAMAVGHLTKSLPMAEGTYWTNKYLD